MASKVMKQQNGAYMTCRGFNGRCVVAWLANALAMFQEHRTDEAAGRTVGVWVQSAVQSGQLQQWPQDSMLSPTLEALSFSLHYI